MAKYVLGDKEVSEKEFYKSLFKSEDSERKEMLEKVKHSLLNSGRYIGIEDITNIMTAGSEEALKNFFEVSTLSSTERSGLLPTESEWKEAKNKQELFDGLSDAIRKQSTSHTGATVFEKVQNHNLSGDFTIISNPDPLDVYNAIIQHKTWKEDLDIYKEQVKSQAIKAEDYPNRPIVGWRPVPKKENTGKKESQTVEKAPVFTYCKQMKNAIEALSLRSLYGHNKYEKGDDWENFSRVENADFEYSNAALRHALGIGEDSDEDHLVASAWNAIARLEIYLRNKK